MKIGSEEYVKLIPGRYSTVDTWATDNTKYYQPITNFFINEMIVSNQTCCQIGFYFNK